MEIRITYVCDGAIYCGFKPENADVKEERQVLYPSKGHLLERKSDSKQFHSLWLKDGDTEENYTEIEEKKEDDNN